MMEIKNIRISLLSLLFILSFVACDKNGNDAGKPEDASLSLSFTSRAEMDNLAKGNDSKFSSLAIYVFNKTDGSCDYFELVPDITPEAIDLYRRVLTVSSQPKVIYAIGNYTGGGKTLSVNLTENTTMQELDNMTVTSTDFSESSVLMIGKKEITMTGISTDVEVPMKRLVARLDIYMFKNSELTDDNVQVVSVEFVNQVMNSKCDITSREMLNPVKMNNQIEPITTNTTLQNMPSDLSSIIPENAHASFYSYQNIIPASATVDESITPYLSVVLNINGKEYKCKGYITDTGHTTDKYSLNQNTVYQILAMFDHPDNKLALKIIPLPWTVAESQIDGTLVKEGDYLLGAYSGNDDGATTGTVYFPYVKNNIPVSETSYASYSFKLTAPAGAVWTATLTNGLDFFFSKEGVVGNQIAVSQGVARENEYIIRVGATRSWSGVPKNTYMYITVNGKKLKINPLQNGGTRKFPGSNDTDILITQKGYK